MSTEVDSNNIVDVFTTYEDLKAGEALAHILAAASIVTEIEGDNIEIKDTVRKYVDLWISKVSPIDYSPGLAEVIGMKLKKNLIKIFEEISEKELGETLDLIIDVKQKADVGVIDVDFMELEVRVERILRALGIDLNEMGRFFNFMDPIKKINRLISILTVAIGIAAVWDGRWIVESQ